MLCAHHLDQDPRQSCDGDIEQVTHWKSRRLEVDPDHRSDLEINEQQKEV
jgi:hypothetical protein